MKWNIQFIYLSNYTNIQLYTIRTIPGFHIRVNRNHHFLTFDYLVIIFYFPAVQYYLVTGGITQLYFIYLKFTKIKIKVHTSLFSSSNSSSVLLYKGLIISGLN